MTGPGLEGVLPDALCKRIQMRYMLPYFREGDYSAGMVAGLRAVASVLEGSELDSGGNDDFRAADDLPVWAVFLIVFLVVLVPLGIMLVGFYHSRRCPRCRAFALVLQSRNLVADGPLQPVRRHLPLRQMRFRREAAVPKCTQR